MSATACLEYAFTMAGVTVPEVQSEQFALTVEEDGPIHPA